MHLNDTKTKQNTQSSNSGGGGGVGNCKKGGNNNNDSILNRNRRDNDAKSASTVMSNLSSYSLIDDDHIDDQETINVGNLIIDLESDLEKEKIEIEQQANAKPTTCTTTSTITSALNSKATPLASSSTPSSSFVAANNRASSSTTLSGKTSSKHSNISSINSNNNINAANSSSGINSSSGPVSNSVLTNSATNSNGHVMTTRTVFKMSSDDRGELKMRITRETKPGKSEHKIVTSPSEKSPTSSSGGNLNTTNSHTSNCEDVNSNESSNSRLAQSSSSISSTKECGTSTSIGTITEPDCLGPCEPGTSVTLEGIVWQETEGGILVVNVTWRGKTYVGALLDCTKHDWAPPRLCDSPASDVDSKTHKAVRTKRIVTRSNGIGLDEKNLLQTTGKLRNGKGRKMPTSSDPASCNKRQRESEKSNENSGAQAEATTLMANANSITDSETACVPMNIDTTPQENLESASPSDIATEIAGPNSPILIGCSEPNCSKKYRNMNGLLYHRTHAHGTENDSNATSENNRPSSAIDKVDTLPTKNERLEQKGPAPDNNDRSSPISNDSKSNQDVKVLLQSPEKRKTPSPRLTVKAVSKAPQDASNNNVINNSNNTVLNQEPRLSVSRSLELERRSSSNSNHSPSMDFNRRSPGGPRLLQDPVGHASMNNHSAPKSNPSASFKQSNLVPLPATNEEGMKPSGTSTGPPPAPHQANCYFNSAFLASSYHPYLMPNYFPRGPSMYDIGPPSPANTLLSRFMPPNVRGPPPPESPSRLLSPSVSKNLPYPPYKLDPGAMPVPLPPNSQMGASPIPNLMQSSLPSGSPLLRMPSHVDSMMPLTSQPPFPPPAGLNSVLGLPGNPMGTIGGPQVPSLVDDSMAKQFPRRFN